MTAREFLRLGLAATIYLGLFSLALALLTWPGPRP